MRPLQRLAFVFALLLALGVGFAFGVNARQSAWAESSGDPYERLNTFAQVLSKIEQNYVETVDGDTLIYGALKGMVRALDPHSSFLTPDELKALRERTEGSFVGVGIEVGVRNGRLTVIAPIPGGSAEAAGIEAGDVISAIEGEVTREMSLDEAIKRIRGEEGTKVKVTISREGAEDREVELERTFIKLQAVKGELLEPGYGLIKVQSFSRNVGHDVRAAYDNLVVENKDEDLKGLVLDLRANPGGLLREAVDLTNVFLEEGLIVSTEGREGYELATHEANPLRHYIDLPLVVLVNGGSASASEIVAGALQDHGRAVIVGTQTFGKGSVQNIYDLDDGSGLKLTIARYYTPSHRSIQGMGITPDVIAEDIELDPPAAPARRFDERSLPNALDGEGEVAEVQPPPPRELPLRTALAQLKALEILGN